MVEAFSAKALCSDGPGERNEVRRECERDGANERDVANGGRMVKKISPGSPGDVAKSYLRARIDDVNGGIGRRSAEAAEAIAEGEIETSMWSSVVAFERVGAPPVAINVAPRVNAAMATHGRESGVWAGRVEWSRMGRIRVSGVARTTTRPQRRESSSPCGSDALDVYARSIMEEGKVSGLRDKPARQFVNPKTNTGVSLVF
ncbi:Uncharacterised protein [Burkholderia pseudomallei]|nr:Uncharacterised protein [Burkholderia pseudomallei]VCK72326.1 Uncharacterised protein [Burkholderia pseudomallei]VCK79761.1 Uncharacterised protein [Burkholderia pseudomallei]VCK80242.1 Uncharacterised protein [Burkholderia pseudomallei]VCK80595.1 Uncharacterised protein [Burkholderia pseudomallei]